MKLLALSKWNPWMLPGVLLSGCFSAKGGEDTAGAELEAEARQFLDAHNAVRAGVEPAAEPSLPALSWDAELAEIARGWAEGCVFEHSSGSAPGAELGENLAFFSGRASTPEQVVTAWAGEAELFDYEGNSCADGEQCGHYTQVVWRDTERVGCGRADCDMLGGDGIFWVCNYDPPGNWVGERPY